MFWQALKRYSQIVNRETLTFYEVLLMDSRSNICHGGYKKGAQQKTTFTPKLYGERANRSQMEVISCNGRNTFSMCITR
jgi:hypothetical protein